MQTVFSRRTIIGTVFSRVSTSMAFCSIRFNIAKEYSVAWKRTTPNKMYHQKIRKHSKQHSYHPRQNRPDQQTVLSSPSSHSCLLLKLERVP